MSAVLAFRSTFDIEAEIIQAAKESVARMRAGPAPTEQQLLDEMCAASEQGWFLEWLRENRDNVMCAALMPMAILGVAWIAEQTMRSV